MPLLVDLLGRFELGELGGDHLVCHVFRHCIQILLHLFAKQVFSRALLVFELLLHFEAIFEELELHSGRVVLFF